MGRGAIRGPGDSIAPEAADCDGRVYRWHFLFAEDGFVMLAAEEEGDGRR